MTMTIADIARMKAAGERIPMVTCYDHSAALIAARAGLNFILVGDSLGQVVLGQGDTLGVTLDDMVRHAAAVLRGAPEALVVVDMPFLSYASVDEAVRSAGRLVREAGARALKLEGGQPVLPVVRALVDLGLPIMGHLGFTPQSSHQIGVRVQGRSVEAAAQLIADSEALQEAGAFAIVLELVPMELAEAITARLTIPTIGIGAGAGCAGQVQVWHDILGLFDQPPFRHSRRYGEVGATIEAVLRDYSADVRAGTFPTAANASSMKADVVAAALARADGRDRG